MSENLYMQNTTLVLTQRSTQDSRHLELAAAKLGWRIHRAMRMSLPDTLSNPTVFGDVAFCDVVAETYGLGLLETTDKWLPSLPYKYLQRVVDLIQHKDLPKITERRFIKPANDKVFQAGIFDKGDHVPHREIRPTAPVLVSEIVEFDVEVRCHVLDREVVSASIYQGLSWGSTPEYEAKILEQAEAWMDDFLEDSRVDIPSAIVIDVGRIPEVGWVVIEANQAYASGVYAGGYNSKEGRGADPEQVLKVVRRAAQSRELIAPSDVPWIRPSKDRA